MDLMLEGVNWSDKEGVREILIEGAYTGIRTGIGNCMYPIDYRNLLDLVLLLQITRLTVDNAVNDTREAGLFDIIKNKTGLVSVIVGRASISTPESLIQFLLNNSPTLSNLDITIYRCDIPYIECDNLVATVKSLSCRYKFTILLKEPCSILAAPDDLDLNARQLMDKYNGIHLWNSLRNANSLVFESSKGSLTKAAAKC